MVEPCFSRQSKSINSGKLYFEKKINAGKVLNYKNVELFFYYITKFAIYKLMS